MHRDYYLYSTCQSVHTEGKQAYCCHTHKLYFPWAPPEGTPHMFWTATVLFTISHNSLPGPITQASFLHPERGVTGCQWTLPSVNTVCLIYCSNETLISDISTHAVRPHLTNLSFVKLLNNKEVYKTEMFKARIKAFE